MGRQLIRYVSDYEDAGEKLVAVCMSCHRTAILSYQEIGRRGKHMVTLEELVRVLRCRNCRRKNAEVRLASSIRRPPANGH